MTFPLPAPWPAASADRTKSAVIAWTHEHQKQAGSDSLSKECGTGTNELELKNTVESELSKIKPPGGWEKSWADRESQCAEREAEEKHLQGCRGKRPGEGQGGATAPKAPGQVPVAQL